MLSRDVRLCEWRVGGGGGLQRLEIKYEGYGRGWSIKKKEG